ncbi:unnamed protein product [Caenorhabditis brenneri]
MSIEPVFPLLKLPYLCIEAVILNLSPHDIVHFSQVSKRTCRLVKSFKSPVTSMRLYLDKEGICLNLEPTEEHWHSSQPHEEVFENINYFTGLFRCSVDYLKIDGDYLPENNLDFGFNKLKKFFISGSKEITNDKLKYLVEHFEVTEVITIDIPVSNTFYCDPKLFKARCTSFNKPSGWITGNFLSQLPLDSIRRLTIEHPQFTVKDVVLVITKWFQFEAPSLKALVITLNVPVDPVDLENECFELVVFSPERRPAGLLTKSGELIDMSGGLDVVRSDGQLATILIEGSCIVFHIWSEDERRGVPS